MTKACVVAIGRPMMQLNPIDAVLESITVPSGCNTAALFAMPSSLMNCLVRASGSSDSTPFALMSSTVTHGIVQSFQ